MNPDDFKVSYISSEVLIYPFILVTCLHHEIQGVTTGEFELGLEITCSRGKALIYSVHNTFCVSQRKSLCIESLNN